MKIFKMILMIFCFSLVFNGNLVFAQSAEKSKDGPVSTQSKDKSTNNKKEEPGDYFPENEFESPFRYVVVWEDVRFEDEEKQQVPLSRFVRVLMEERAFNEANLIYLFKYLSKHYAAPQYLQIEVHTSLLTLETPEESVKVSTHSSRDRFLQFYKTANYNRFDDGNEGFDYFTGKPGKFIRKSVDLIKTTKK